MANIEPLVLHLMKEEGITREQANELWTKSMSFNQIFIDKYGDNYFKHSMEIMNATKAYQRKLLEKYKKENK